MSLTLSSLLRTDGLHVLNTESAKGFIVIINNKYVLKFCILSDDHKDFPNINKFSTSLSEFYEEIDEQHRAYLLTQVCPPILFARILQNNQALDYFWLIEKRCLKNTNQHCVSVFNKLQEEFNADTTLKCGIIAMPYVDGVSYANTMSWPINIRRQIVANCIYNVVLLYVKAQRIHGDLHETNIIVNPNTLQCQFIDFGVIEHVDNHTQMPSNTSLLTTFLNKLEPWLEFLSGDTTFYRIRSNRQRIYEKKLLDMCVKQLK